MSEGVLEDIIGHFASTHALSSCFLGRGSGGRAPTASAFNIASLILKVNADDDDDRSRTPKRRRLARGVMQRHGKDIPVDEIPSVLGSFCGAHITEDDWTLVCSSVVARRAAIAGKAVRPRLATSSTVMPSWGGGGGADHSHSAVGDCGGSCGRRVGWDGRWGAATSSGAQGRGAQPHEGRAEKG